MKGECQNCGGGASSTLNRLSRAMLLAIDLCVFLSVLLGPMYFGAWLSREYGPALDWPETCGMGSGFVAGAHLYQFARLDSGWRCALLASLGAGTIAALHSANMIAVAAVLWALDPAFVTGFGGWVVVFLIATFLAAPVIIGANRLIAACLRSGLPLNEWIKDRLFHGVTRLGLVLAVAAAIICKALAAFLENWLVAVFPAADDVSFLNFFIVGVLPVCATLAFAGPVDWRSAARAAFAALVVFVAAMCSAVAVAAITVTLQTDYLIVNLLQLSGVVTFLGASLLMDHRPDGWGDEAPKAVEEELQA